MRKFRKLILMCVLMMSAASFSGCGNQNNANDTNDVNNNDTSVADDIKDAGDNVIDAGEDAVNGEKDAVVTYDKNGVLLSSKESGQPAKIYFYNENGELEETKEHIYSVGEAVQVQKYSESGNLLYSLDYEINVLGATFKSRTDFTDDSGKSFIKTVYEYKKDGSISEITAFNEKGLVVKEERFGNGTNIRDSKTIYHYNDKNLLAKEEHYYDNELSNYYLFEYYESDALYKIFRYFHYEYIDSVYVDKIFLEYCLEFYENGKCKKYTYYANGILKNETEYDKNEIKTKKISYYENGLFRLEILYTNGKQSKKNLL